MTRVDPDTSKVVATIPVGRTGAGDPYGNGPLAVAIGGGSVWATVPNAGIAVRIDPRWNRVTATRRARSVRTLTARGRSLWAAGSCGETRISRIDAVAGRVAATRDLGDVPGPPVVLGPYVWTVAFSGKLVRLDAQTLKPTGEMGLGGLDVEGEALAASYGSLWVRAQGFVVRLIPRWALRGRSGLVQSLVEPSTSVKRNVTVPIGSSERELIRGDRAGRPMPSRAQSIASSSVIRRPSAATRANSGSEIAARCAAS